MNEELTSFHDAELVGVDHDRAHETVSLTFSMPDGHVSKISFQDVVVVRITNYGLQNVVLRLMTSTSSELTPADRRRMVEWAFSDADGSQLGNPTSLHDLMDRVSSGAALVFYLEPSWGAEATVVARSMTIARLGKYSP